MKGKRDVYTDRIIEGVKKLNTKNTKKQVFINFPGLAKNSVRHIQQRIHQCAQNRGMKVHANYLGFKFLVTRA